jgi:hypothetical protein
MASIAEAEYSLIRFSAGFLRTRTGHGGGATDSRVT